VKRYFITYANEAFAGARDRIVAEANATGEFDEVIGYGPEDVSDAVRKGPLFGERRGGGYWTWKPDIIYQTLESCDENDIVVYADSGCQVVPGTEWSRYWRILEKKELIVQRIYQVVRNWTRKSVIDAFSAIPAGWLGKSQFMATVLVMRKTPYIMSLVAEWRKLMIERPDMVCDVPREERSFERSDFIENRHDQAVLSALLYRDLACSELNERIHVMWEHVENLSLFRSQVIRAMRLRDGRTLTWQMRVREVLLRLFKDVVKKPWYVLAHG